MRIPVMKSINNKFPRYRNSRGAEKKEKDREREQERKVVKIQLICDFLFFILFSRK